MVKINEIPEIKEYDVNEFNKLNAEDVFNFNETCANIDDILIQNTLLEKCNNIVGSDSIDVCEYVRDDNIQKLHETKLDTDKIDCAQLPWDIQYLNAKRWRDAVKLTTNVNKFVKSISSNQTTIREEFIN